MGVAHSTNEPHIEAGKTSTHKSISSEAKRGHKREVRPTVGHHFESSTVQGGARAHFGDHHGDQHHYHYAESSARDSIIDDGGSGATERLRKALAFSEMNYRFMTINHPSPQTCRWFFETPEYTRWRDQEFQRKHHGLLWVKGKPGSGKSTITKCALEHARETYIQEKTIYFFFNARGKTLLEKTTQGMFRSLLYQMAEDVPWLLRAVDLEAAEMYKKQGWPLELLDAQDQDGNSSLHLAVRRGRVETTRTLLFYGADVYSRHRGGKSVMDIAQECDDGKEWERRIIIQLLSYFSDVPTTARFEAGCALEAKDWWREYRDRYTLGGAEDQRAAATASRSTRPTQPSPPQRPSKTPPSPPPPSP